VIQSRFFHSSLQEIQLNVKEIYSLQGELRESVVNKANKANKTVRFDKVRPEDLERSTTSAPTTFAAAQDSSVPVSISTQIEIAANEVRPIEQGVLNQQQPRRNTPSTPIRGSGFKTGQYTKDIPIENSDEPPKNTKLQSRTLPFWVGFLIWETSALLVLIFFIL
jgi:hypothetical protein